MSGVVFDWWRCPNGRCRHGSVVHDRDDISDQTPRCCIDGCDCGLTVPEPMIRVPNPVFEAVVERRARQLCARAEPHEVEERCHVHESEARRHLVSQWQSQSHEEPRP